MKSRLAALMLALGLVVSAGSSADAGPEDRDPVSIAVVPVAAINLPWEEAETLAAKLRQALAAALEVDVASGDRMWIKLGARVRDSCMSQADCIRDVGAKLEVDQLLFLAVVRIGTRIQVKVTWAEVASGTSATREPVRIDDEGDAVAAFKQAAARLIPEASVRPPDSAGAPPDAGSPPAVTAPDATSAVTTGPADKSRGRRLGAGVWISGGIAVAALAGGSAFGVKALRTRDDLRDVRTADPQCAPSCPVDQDDVDRMVFQRDVADVMFGVAIVAGVTATVLYVRSGKKQKSRLDVAATPSGAGVTFTSRF